MNLIDSLHILKKRAKLIALAPLACAALAAAVCWLALPNQYTTNLSLYVLASADPSSAETANADLAASQMLTNDVSKVVGGMQASDRAARTVGADTLDAYDVAVASDSSTRVIALSVTGPSASGVVTVAEALASEADSVARSVMDVKSVSVIEPPREPEAPSGPPRVLYTAAAFATGLFAAVALALALDRVDTRVRSGEEAASALDLPIIGRVPAFKE